MEQHKDCSIQCEFDVEPLREWFLENKRDLPWRNNPTPYEVWISEVMLQQTQVERVIIYFDRWMQAFPTINSLAQSSIETVLKLWEGLGYYSRARSLHQAAQYIVEHHNGELPETYDELEKVKGLGPYTIGAIRSFAFHQKAACVDANVIRVLSRVFAIQDEVTKTHVQKKIWGIADSILPDSAPWEVSEGLIELGAVVCKKTPQCMNCPLQAQCAGFRHGLQSMIPCKKSTKASTALFRDVLLIIHDTSILMRQVPKGQIFADLWEFPYIETKKGGIDPKVLIQSFYEQNGQHLVYQKGLHVHKQSFTRYKVELYPNIFHAKELFPVTGFSWVMLEEVSQLALSSGHKKIFNTLWNYISAFEVDNLRGR